MTTAISKEKRDSTLAVPAKARLPWSQDIQEEFGIDQTVWRALVETKFASATSVDTVKLGLSYCKARKLDPMKGAIHIVPVWDSKSRSMVDTIWPGIGELRTTAFRTREYAGRGETVFGPNVTENLGGVDVTFPEWAQVTVRRMVAGAIADFVGPRVYWIEAYATKSRDSDAPNEMWMTRKRGQIEKCAEAASLRAAFPEEIGTEYCHDEIRQFERGGVVIDANTAPPAKTLNDVAARLTNSGQPQDAAQDETPAVPALFSKCMRGFAKASDHENLDMIQSWVREGDTSDWNEDQSFQFDSLMDQKRGLLPLKAEPKK